MTVAELIAFLQTMPPEMIVRMPDGLVVTGGKLDKDYVYNGVYLTDADNE